MKNVNFVLVARPANCFRPLEELSAREEALCIYSDVYKEAHGMRPRFDMSGVTAGQLYREIRSLGRFIEMEMKWEHEREVARQEAERLEAEKLARVTEEARTRREWTLGDFWEQALA